MPPYDLNDYTNRYKWDYIMYSETPVKTEEKTKDYNPLSTYNSDYLMRELLSRFNTDDLKEKTTNHEIQIKDLEDAHVIDSSSMRHMQNLLSELETHVNYIKKHYKMYSDAVTDVQRRNTRLRADVDGLKGSLMILAVLVPIIIGGVLGTFFHFLD